MAPSPRRPTRPPHAPAGRWPRAAPPAPTRTPRSWAPGQSAKPKPGGPSSSRPWARSKTAEPTPTPGGLSGLATAARGALPIPPSKGKKSNVNPSSGAAAKAKPALAFLAAGAGAILGGRQLQKRRRDADALPDEGSQLGQASSVEAATSAAGESGSPVTSVPSPLDEVAGAEHSLSDHPGQKGP